jgi:hypothetical protein
MQHSFYQQEREDSGWVVNDGSGDIGELTRRGIRMAGLFWNAWSPGSY